MNSIFRKELRDCLRWVPAGILIAVVMVWQALPTGVNEAIGFEAVFLQSLGWAAALIAFSLGLLQSLFDIRNEARGYLVHRPVHASTIFWAKVFSGFAAYILSIVPAILLAAFYLAWQGLDHLPVSPLQVIPAAILTLTVFLLHPVAIWIGNRDAKWIGTRTLPLAGIALVIVAVVQIFDAFHNGYIFGRTFLLGILVWVSNLAALIVVFTAARHAFCKRQMLPPRSEQRAASWASIVGLTFSSIVVVTIAAVLFSETLQTIRNPNTSYTTRELQMNSDGEFQQVQTKVLNWNWKKAEISVRPAQSTADFVPVDDARKPPEYSHVIVLEPNEYSWFHQFTQVGQFASSATDQGNMDLIAHQGRLLAYGRNRLAAVTTPQAVFRDGQLPKGRFQNLKIATYVRSVSNSLSQVNVNPFIVDSTGVSQLDTDTFEVTPLTSHQSERLCMLLARDEIPATLWTVHGDALTRHTISAIDSEKSLDEEMLDESAWFSLPLVKVDDSKTFKIDSLDESDSISVFRADDGRHGYVRYNYKTTEHFYGMLEDDGNVGAVGPVIVPPVLQPSQNGFALVISPILVVVNFVASNFIYNTIGGADLTILIFGIAQALCVALGTFLICNFYDLTGRQKLIWTVIGALGGWGIWLAVVACHRRLVKESCPSCQKATRVDMETCTHCEKPWLPPEPDQVEIFDNVSQVA